MEQEQVQGKLYDGQLLLRLAVYIKPYGKQVAATVVLLSIHSLLESVGPILTAIAIDRYLVQRAPGAVEGISQLSVVLLGVSILILFAEFGQALLMQWTGQRAMFALRRDLMAQLHRLDIAYFDKHPVGRLVTRVTSGGPFPNVYALALQPDGKILVGGNFGLVNGESRNGIARLNADGTLDTAFNPGKGTGYYRDVYSVALQTDGKILVGGNFRKFDNHDRQDLARLHPNGALDEFFSPGHGTANKAGSGEIHSVAIQPDGKLVIGGRFSSVQGKGRDDIARLNADGSVDGEFRPMSGTGPAENYLVYAVALESDQRLLIGGRFSAVNAGHRSNIARLHR